MMESTPTEDVTTNTELTPIQTNADTAVHQIDERMDIEPLLKNKRDAYVTNYINMLTKNMNDRKYSYVIRNLVRGIINEEKIDVNSGSWNDSAFIGQDAESIVHAETTLNEHGEFVFKILTFLRDAGLFDATYFNQYRSLIRQLLYFNFKTKTLSDFMNLLLTLAYLNKQIPKKYYSKDNYNAISARGLAAKAAEKAAPGSVPESDLDYNNAFRLGGSWSVSV